MHIHNVQGYIQYQHIPSIATYPYSVIACIRIYCVQVYTCIVCTVLQEILAYMVIQGIYVSGYSMYECTGIQAYSFTFGTTALQCIALYRYTVIHQRSFCNLFCGCHLYNSILSIALQVIFKSKARVAMFGILQMWLNAQQILLCQWAGNARQISRH